MTNLRDLIRDLILEVEHQISEFGELTQDDKDNLEDEYTEIIKNKFVG